MFSRFSQSSAVVVAEVQCEFQWTSRSIKLVLE